MLNHLTGRKDTYHKLNTEIAFLDNTQLYTLFNNAVETTRGWGINHVIELGDCKLFVKRVPLTELESQHPFSTKNHFDLPSYYNYGVGSAGFGVYRELLTHIKTTNWVLSGQCVHFPLMYHYRVLPRTAPTTPISEERYKRYVAYWNGNQNIGNYALAHDAAPYELVLFLEYFPYTLGDYFRQHVDQTEQVIVQAAQTLTFLRQQQLRHGDVHFGNIVSDGEQIYFADFGLAQDWAFDLSAAERQFFQQNRYLDDASLLNSLAFLTIIRFRELHQSQQQAARKKYELVDEGALTWADKTFLIEHIERVYADGIIPLERHFVETVLHFREPILLIRSFLEKIVTSSEKQFSYDHARLQELLESVTSDQ